ncbi:MAG: hypothetical protein SWO11_08650 [Thermodesulfobacteriota bacterium]|nr:hypothetical protein [Thermodesulfobacteriota bacterium]
MIDKKVIEQDLKRLNIKMSQNPRLMHFMLGMLNLYESLEQADLLFSFIDKITNFTDEIEPFIFSSRVIVV